MNALSSTVPSSEDLVSKGGCFSLEQKPRRVRGFLFCLQYGLIALEEIIRRKNLVLVCLAESLKIMHHSKTERSVLICGSNNCISSPLTNKCFLEFRV